MLDIVATDQNELASSIHVGSVNDGEPRLAPTPRGIGQALASVPPHKPQRQRENAEYHDEREKHLERVAIEQGVEHHSSPVPSGSGARRDRSK
jgi:hypothetical protein